jgi:hypothetical protein
MHSYTVRVLKGHTERYIGGIVSQTGETAGQVVELVPVCTRGEAFRFPSEREANRAIANMVSQFKVSGITFSVEVL